MTELERLALAVAILTARVNQMFEHVSELKHKVQDLQDIFKGCACFGTDEQSGGIEP